MDNLQEKNKFFERYNLPRLNQEEIENMNRPITSTEIETDKIMGIPLCFFAFPLLLLIFFPCIIFC